MNTPRLINRAAGARVVYVGFGDMEYLAGTYVGHKRIMGIYRISCTKTGKSYVGASVDILHRVSDHFYGMKTWPNERQMYRDANQFGFDTMQVEVLECVDDPGELSEAEDRWIRKLDSARNGYNQQASGKHWTWLDSNG